MTDTKSRWIVGQKVMINRDRIVTIERVTPSGRAVIGNRIFEPDGRERGSDRSYYARDVLEALTPEIKSETERRRRGDHAFTNADKALDAASVWLRKTSFNPWHRVVPDPEDIEKAERLYTAIRQVIGDD